MLAGKPRVAEPNGAGSVDPLRRNGQEGMAERHKSMLKAACVKGNRRGVHPECRVRRYFRCTRITACRTNAFPRSPSCDQENTISFNAAFVQSGGVFSGEA
jgi:hypothetical protein